jgi:hypothetical protein
MRIASAPNAVSPLKKPSNAINMQLVLSLALAIYLFFYVFEGLIRYGLHLAAADGFIFLRDALLGIPLLILFLQQCLRRNVHPAYGIFIAVILVHGLVMLLNIGSTMAVVYSIKMLMTLLAGVLLADRLFRPSRAMLLLVLLLWSIAVAGIVADKYYVAFPWTGMETTFEDIKVEISRDWQIEGEDKRAGGFLRSSINAATVLPLLAFMLMFHLRRRSLRVLIALLTVPALILTTQKGPIIAYGLTLSILTVAFKNPIPLLRIGVLAMLLLAIGLPLVLSGNTMPSADGGVFSFSSFYQRIEQMWPEAWRWIHAHEAFPFGVGLGGISGAQRLYALNDMNAADNVFILMYGYFGIMSFIYLGFIGVVALRTKSKGSPSAVQSMATLVYLIGYGCVISLLEDQMASLFLGAALGWLCMENKKSKSQTSLEASSPMPGLVMVKS